MRRARRQKNERRYAGGQFVAKRYCRPRRGLVACVRQLWKFHTEPICRKTSGLLAVKFVYTKGIHPYGRHLLRHFSQPFGPEISSHATALILFDPGSGQGIASPVRDPFHQKAARREASAPTSLAEEGSSARPDAPIPDRVSYQAAGARSRSALGVRRFWPQVLWAETPAGLCA